MKRRKRTYDSNLIYLALYDNASKKQILQIVPSSTYYGWLEKGGEHFYGKEFASQNHATAIDIAKKLARSQRLIKIAKGMYFMYSTYKSIVDAKPDLKKILREKKELIVNTFHAAARYISKSKLYNILDVSYDFIHYKNLPACASSIFSKCLKKHPFQLSAAEVSAIRDYLTHPIYKNWQGISIYWQLIRDRKLFCSKTTFYRCLNTIGFRFKKRKNNWKNYIPIVAKKPFEILHMDVTPIILNNLKGYLYLIIDNFSRSILSYEFSKEIKSYIATKNLIKACRKYNLQINPYVTLITDGGPENKGYINRFINLPCVNIVRKIAQSDITSSNAIAESVNKQLKQYHLNFNPDDDFDKAAIQVDIGISQYSNKPLDAHKGFTPTEILNSPELIQKHTFFSKEEIKTLREKRRISNKINACGSCH
ncbi:MAG: hypothetical protein ACKOXB_10665 [Flavobacteriales bacterium]